MFITYKDDLGIVYISLDDSMSIVFCDGFALFTSVDGTDHKVPVSDVLEIGKE